MSEAVDIDDMERQLRYLLDDVVPASPSVVPDALEDALELCAEVRRLRAALEELTGGDGTYYIAQERAMAPGIQRDWPDVIPVAPHGRLVRRAALAPKGDAGGVRG